MLGALKAPCSKPTLALLLDSRIDDVLSAAGPLLEQTADQRPVRAHTTVVAWLRRGFDGDIAVEAGSHADEQTTELPEDREALVRTGQTVCKRSPGERKNVNMAIGQVYDLRKHELPSTVVSLLTCDADCPHRTLQVCA